ncbi:hypothetical protein [Gordonia terrae]
MAVLPAWWESQYFTADEQAALTVAEHITRIGDTHAAAQSAIDAATALNDQQIAALTWLAIVANGWNRIAVSSPSPPPSAARSRAGDRLDDPGRTWRPPRRDRLMTAPPDSDVARLHAPHYGRVAVLGGALPGP